MKLKEYFFSDTQRYSWLKNTLQFLVGATFFISMSNSADILKILISLIGAVMAYHSVYGLNDIIDLKEDSKNPLKRSVKKVARGEITIEEQASRIFLHEVIGLSICFYVSMVFGLLIAAALVLNFFHSYKPFGIKNTPFGMINLFLIESIKFSSLWFALGGGFGNFPYFLVICISAIYSVSYFIYKKEGDLSFIRSRRSMIFFAVIILSYFSSFYYYQQLRITALAILPVFFLPLLIKKSANVESRIRTGSEFTLLILLILNLANLSPMIELFKSISIFLASLF
ncbi:MAG TPA: UbiA family prenyltransferase [archaeon]|nr:UbiA family prenyltransferase [archaeon]